MCPADPLPAVPVMRGPLFEPRADPALPPGFLHGMRHPAVVLPLIVREIEGAAERIADLESQLGTRIPEVKLPPFRPAPRCPAGDMVQRLLYWIARLQAEANWSLAEAPHARATGVGVNVFVPSLPMGQGAAAMATLWVIRAFSSAAAGAKVAWGGLAKVRSDLASHAGKASNMPRLLRAANQLGMPWDRLTDKVFTFGQGARMRWLDSTFTDETPYLSTGLARRKQDCANLLRRAGLPAPVHRLVHDEDEAVRAAQQIGYPVVVKPADRDGGIAVAADLRGEAEVREAFGKARAKSANILVERHFEGRDFRLTVFHGRLFWATERIPAGVTGDGVQNVEALVAQVNADPDRGSSALATLKKIQLDAETDALLARQGLARSSVPDAGRFVRLRRASNVALGGLPVAVTSDVHPDNAALAVRAAHLLRLDMAGIDLLIPDIRRSWLETGALICEVNAQPALGQLTAAHLYVPILRELVPGNGRIPIAVVVGAADPDALGRAVAGKLAAHACNVVWAGPTGAGLLSERLGVQPLAAYEAGLVVLAERRADAAVVFIDAADPLSKGLAFDRFDVLATAVPTEPDLRLAILVQACRDGVKAPAADAGWIAAQLLAARAKHEAAV
jgi:cyanophycin synthetase